MRHPAEFYLKYLMLREPQANDARLIYDLQQNGFLPPADDAYLGILRQSINPPPEGFNPLDRTHRPSMQYLRAEGVHEMFFPTAGVNGAIGVLSDIAKRTAVEQSILARLNFKDTAKRLNTKHGWFLTQEIFIMYRHFFWNMDLLTYDHWGRYLYNRSAMYGNYRTLLMGDKHLAFFHLRLDQTIDSKAILRRALEIAAFNLEEVNLVPGPQADKIKNIGILNKAVVDCHNALSTSDMAMGGVLKQLEKFRVVPTDEPAKSIRLLAPTGNYSHSGVEEVKKEEDPVH